MHLIIRAATLLPTLLILLAIAPNAMAGTYQQFTCKLPDGTPAGVDGWEASDFATYWSLTNACATGGALDAQMENVGMTTGPTVSWTWTAPSPLQLMAIDVKRAVRLAAGGTGVSPVAQVVSGSDQLESNQGPASVGDMSLWNAEPNALRIGDASRLTANAVTASIGCVGPKGSACPKASGPPSTLRIHAATFTLSDDIAPTVSNRSGSLMSGGAKSGVEQITFSAADAGGGVYRAVASVDGAIIGRPVLSNASGTCQDAFPADGDPYQFEARKPCPSTVDGATLPVDTRQIADGDHLVEILVEDVAGNRAPVYGPATISVRNAASATPGSLPGSPGTPTPGGSTVPSNTPNGTNATPTARLDIISVPRTVRLQFGRTTTLRGRLTTPSGTGIAGAAIEVAARTSLPGESWSNVASIQTDASGAFSYRVPVGASRTLRLSYRARTGDAQPVESDDVVVRVTSRVDLRLNRSRLRNGQTLRYLGRIQGAYARDRLAEIQVRVQGRWRVVCVTRARSGGRFGCTYRFRHTFVRALYTFRAVVRQQAGFPYEPGTSPTRRVSVSPR